MKPNPLPYLFLPGVVLVGYLVAEWSGVEWALASWCGVVLIGTMMSLRRHLAERRRAMRTEPSSDPFEDPLQTAQAIADQGGR